MLESETLSTEAFMTLEEILKDIVHANDHIFI